MLNPLSLKSLPASDLFASGTLRTRLLKNLDRLEREADYSPAVVFGKGEDWPGDYPGRLILSLVHLERVLGVKAKYLREIMHLLPTKLNAEGYLGPIHEVIDEQQLSGHGWLVSGLAEYYRDSQDLAILKLAVRICEKLFFRMRGRMHTYPCKPEQRVFQGGQAGTTEKTINGWTLSTDIGCAFIALEGLVKVAHLTGRPDMFDLIQEMHQTFDKIDLVAVSAQLHASLSASRLFLQHGQRTGNPAMIATAGRVWQLFRDTAITENYANYNWFRRPTWNEPCAIVDAIALGIGLWKQTGNPSYLEDVHAIYYNALGYAQKPHGGFGCDTCVGYDATFLEVKFYDVPGCCNMRGGVGLAHMAELTWMANESSIALPFYEDSKATLRFADGEVTFEEWALYPEVGEVELQVAAGAVQSPKALYLHVPAWADPQKVEVTLNGMPVQASIASGFARVDAAWKQGDKLILKFPVELRIVQTLNSNNLPGLIGYRHGPLVLGVWEGEGLRDRDGLKMISPGVYQAEGPNAITLRRIDHAFTLNDDAAQRDRKKILFRP